MGGMMDLYERARRRAERYSTLVGPMSESDRKELAHWVLSGVLDGSRYKIECWVQWWIQRAVEHYNEKALAPWKTWRLPGGGVGASRLFTPLSTDPHVAGQVWNAGALCGKTGLSPAEVTSTKEITTCEECRRLVK